MRFFLFALSIIWLCSHLDSVHAASIELQTDYHQALDAAEQDRKLALIWFFDPTASAQNERFTSETLSEPHVVSLLNERFVAAKLPVDATVQSGDEQVTLLNHPAFIELRRSPGLAIVDMCDPAGPLHRHVVSVFPFSRGWLSPEKLRVLLELPRGSLTQRTLIYAVRTHPEAPASAAGHFSYVLSRETESHAWHQAHITLQGHHNWNSRFHAINAQLPGGLMSREVCAESWPGQNLLDAAEECVHSWRQSSGHWQAVSSRHLLFAYDMKRGANGIWYATGIFASN